MIFKEFLGMLITEVFSMRKELIPLLKLFWGIINS